MKVKEKQDNFYQMAIDSAEAQKKAIVSDYELRLKKESRAYEEQIKSDLDRKKKYETEQIVKDKNMKIAQKTMEIRQSFSNLQATCKEELFELVKEEISSYCKTKEYQEKLCSLIKKTVEDETITGGVIYVTKQDYPIVMNLELPEAITVKESEEEFWGGCKISIPEKKMIINLSYRMKYDELKQQFTFPDINNGEV